MISPLPMKRGDADHGHALFGEADHHVEDFLDHLGIKRAGGLVEAHDLGAHGRRDAVLSTSRDLPLHQPKWASTGLAPCAKDDHGGQHRLIWLRKLCSLSVHQTSLAKIVTRGAGSDDGRAGRRNQGTLSARGLRRPRCLDDGRGRGVAGRDRGRLPRRARRGRRAATASRRDFRRRGVRQRPQHQPPAQGFALHRRANGAPAHRRDAATDHRSQRQVHQLRHLQPPPARPGHVVAPGRALHPHPRPLATARWRRCGSRSRTPRARRPACA